MITMIGILNEGTLQSLTIKNLSIIDAVESSSYTGASQRNANQLEMQILSCFSHPKYNEKMYSNSLLKLDISIRWMHSDLGFELN